MKTIIGDWFNIFSQLFFQIVNFLKKGGGTINNWWLTQAFPWILEQWNNLLAFLNQQIHIGD